MVTEWSSVLDVAVLGVGMAIVATLLWMAYRTMDHPRLPVIFEEDRAPRVTWAGVARYAIMTPILMVFWVLVLLLLILAVARERSPEQILIATSAVIAGARLLAHIKREIAHELAKTVPIVILSVIIIGGQLSGAEAFVTTLNEIPWEMADTFEFGLILWDYLLTALWFGWLYLRWRRRDKPPSAPQRWLNRWRRIGYAD